MFLSIFFHQLLYFLPLIVADHYYFVWLVFDCALYHLVKYLDLLVVLRYYHAYLDLVSVEFTFIRLVLSSIVPPYGVSYYEEYDQVKGPVKEGMGQIHVIEL